MALIFALTPFMRDAWIPDTNYTDFIIIITIMIV